MSGSLLSLSHPISPEFPITPDNPAGRGGVCAQPPPIERPAWRWEGGVLVQPNGREPWRRNWVGLGPEGREEGGGFREEEEEEDAEEGGACCWDWL